MTVETQPGNLVRLGASCPVEDAETLLGLLLANPQAVVDVSGCEHLHTAVFQVLLSARARIAGSFKSDYLRTWIQPMLVAGQSLTG